MVHGQLHLPTPSMATRCIRVCNWLARTVLISTRLLLPKAFIAESTLGGSLFESEIRKRAASASLLGLSVAAESSVGADLCQVEDALGTCSETAV